MPMPYRPYRRGACSLARALPRPATQNNAVVSSWRNDRIQGRHAPQFSLLLHTERESLDRTTAWVRCYFSLT